MTARVYGWQRNCCAALLTTAGLCTILFVQVKHGRRLEKACNMTLGNVSIC